MDTPNYVTDSALAPSTVIPETVGALSREQAMAVLDELIANPTQTSGVTVGVGFLEMLRDMIRHMEA